MNLAERIRQMANLLSPAEIAKAIEIPEEIVEKLLSGEIPDSVLEEYDPEKPPEIRIVEQRRYIRSLIVGVMSIAGAGGTNLTASLATLKAQRDGSKSLAADFNELSLLGTALGIHTNGGEILPNICGLAVDVDLEQCIINHPRIENLDALLGATSLSNYLRLDTEKLLGCVKELGGMYESVWIDCPTSPIIWDKLVSYLDIACILIKPDENSLSALVKASSVFCQADKEKTFVIVRGDKDEGYLKVSECSSIISKLTGFNYLGTIPSEPLIRSCNRQEKNFVVSNPKSVYTEEMKKILGRIVPNPNGEIKEKRGIFRGILGGK